MRMAVVIGNPRPASRTLQIAESVADQIEARLGTFDRAVVDLAAVGSQLFDWPSPTLDKLGAMVANSHVAIFASPTYKGSYTGILKSFLDRYPYNGLANVCAIPVMTGASSQHSISIEVHLRPLLIELGALMPTKGLYFVMPQMGNLERVTADWADQNEAGIQMIGSLLHSDE